jgi:hypothetical protein
MRTRVALVALIAMLFGLFGAAPAEAVRGTRVHFDALQSGLSTSLTLKNTSFSGHHYEQAYQTIRKNVQKSCPPNSNYKLRVESIYGGFAFLKPGNCKTWLAKGLKRVGLFRADYDPTPPPPPPSDEWPNATNSGYLGPLSALTPTKGRQITTDGAVIENQRIDTSDGELGIKAHNVTIRNCVFDVGIWGVFLYNPYSGLVIEDSTFIGGYQAAVGLSQAPDWRISRNNFHSGRDAIKPGGSGIIEDNYFHDPATGGDAHNDVIQFSEADGVTIRHNWMRWADTSNIAMFENQGTFRNVTIDNNFLSRAGYLIYAGGSTGSNIVITNNVMSEWGWPDGWVTDFDIKPGNVWSNNTDLDGNTLNP